MIDYRLEPDVINDIVGVLDDKQNTNAVLETGCFLVFLHAFKVSREHAVDVSEVTICIDQFGF